MGGTAPGRPRRKTSLVGELCHPARAASCIVDSLKDAAVPLTDEAVSAGWNRARQAAIVAGVELLELHHPRKPPTGSQSTWRGAGTGACSGLPWRAEDAWLAWPPDTATS